jgi:hypothetical protein
MEIGKKIRIRDPVYFFDPEIQVGKILIPDLQHCNFDIPVPSFNQSDIVVPF